MRNNAIIRIVLFSLAILILLGIFASVMLGRAFMINVNESGIVDIVQNLFELNEDDTPSPIGQIQRENITASIRNIDIEWVVGSITIEKSPDAIDISVQESSPADSKYELVCKQSGQTLKIKFCQDDFNWIGFGVNDLVRKDLVITVPENWTCDSLEIDTASAKVEISDLTIQEFDFDGASGECLIKNCDIGELDIDTASGNVSFSGTLDALDFDAASADCTIEVTNIPRSIELDGMSGDLELVLPTDAGFICKLDTMSGSFDSDFTFKVHGDTYVCGSGDCKINVSAMSGDVSILKNIR